MAFRVHGVDLDAAGRLGRHVVARRNRQAAEVPHAEAATRPVEVTGAPVETARRPGISLDDRDRFAVKALPLHPFRDLPWRSTGQKRRAASRTRDLSLAKRRGAGQHIAYKLSPGFPCRPESEGEVARDSGGTH